MVGFPSFSALPFAFPFVLLPFVNLVSTSASLELEEISTISSSLRSGAFRLADDEVGSLEDEEAGNSDEDMGTLEDADASVTLAPTTFEVEVPANLTDETAFHAYPPPLPPLLEGVIGFGLLASSLRTSVTVTPEPDCELDWRWREPPVDDNGH